MTPKTSRRDFLSAGLALPIAGAASNLDILHLADAPANKPLPKPTQPAKLDYRILGKTGLKLTTVGFGCMITSDPSVITRAADLGINYFDTARGYGHGNNERMVGAALAAKRRQVVISTKSGAGDKEKLLKDLDTSLSELKTDYVDIWYLHGKDRPEDIRDDMIEAQQIAKQQGKIRFAGMSTHALPKQLDWTAQKKAFDVVLNPKGVYPRVNLGEIVTASLTAIQLWVQVGYPLSIGAARCHEFNCRIEHVLVVVGESGEIDFVGLLAQSLRKLADRPVIITSFNRY